MSSDDGAYVNDLVGIVKALERLRADLAATGAAVPPPTSAAPSAEAPPRDDAPLARLFGVLDAFPSLVGYLKARRSEGLMVLDCEADVQDLLFLALKPHFPDMVYEEPTKKGAAGYSVGDFSVPSLKLVLEAKYVGSPQDAKAKADEIAEDIWKYTTQTDCQRIVFFIYDPHLCIADRPNYIGGLSAASGEFASKGRAVEIQTVIKP